MRRLTLALAAGLTLAAAPAAAQSWGGTYDDRHGSYDARADAAPSSFDWRSQLDRPGDYRCDAFWDASRTDCGAGWRDQRHRVSPQARRDYRELAGHGHSGSGYGRHYNPSGYGRGDLHTRYSYYPPGYGYGSGGAAYYGAYGRPDRVYSSGDYGAWGVHGSRQGWCRATYRSYDPATGYYRAYSGRLVYCG